MNGKYSTDQHRIFAEKLRAASAEKGLSVNALAEAVGVSPEAVKKWRSLGIIPDNPERREKLAKVLDVDLGYLFGDVPRKSERQEVAAEYVGLSLDAVDALRALSEDEQAAVDKILTSAPEKLLAAVSAIKEAIEDREYAALVVSESEKALAAVRQGAPGAENRLHDDLSELRLLQHTQPLKANRAGRALEDLIEAAAPSVDIPDALKYAKEVRELRSSVYLDLLD